MFHRKSYRINVNKTNIRLAGVTEKSAFISRIRLIFEASKSIPFELAISNNSPSHLIGGICPSKFLFHVNLNNWTYPQKIALRRQDILWQLYLSECLSGLLLPSLHNAYHKIPPMDLVVGTEIKCHHSTKFWYMGKPSTAFSLAIRVDAGFWTGTYIFITHNHVERWPKSCDTVMQ